MKAFMVHYTLDNYVYETPVYTSTSGAAIYWIINLFPNAQNVHIVE